MDDKEIYRKLLEVESDRRKNSFFLDIFFTTIFIGFVGWSIAKDISQEIEIQKLNSSLIEEKIIAQETVKQNIELRRTLQQLLDATAPKKNKSEA